MRPVEHNNNCITIINLHNNIINRASDNSRGKKSNFAGFLETNSRRKRPISRRFLGQISPKNKKAKKKDSRKKRYIGRISNSGQERKHKSSSNTVSRQLYLFRATRKT